MTFSLMNTVIKNPDGRIKYKKFKPNGYEHYHIGVWLDSDDEFELEKVEYVTYELHPSFKNRHRVSSDRRNDFAISFWSWGTFKVKAVVHLSDGATREVSHQLQYDLPDDTDGNYVQV